MARPKGSGNAPKAAEKPQDAQATVEPEGAAGEDTQAQEKPQQVAYRAQMANHMHVIRANTENYREPGTHRFIAGTKPVVAMFEHNRLLLDLSDAAAETPNHANDRLIHAALEKYIDGPGYSADIWREQAQLGEEIDVLERRLAIKKALRDGREMPQATPPVIRGVRTATNTRVVPGQLGTELAPGTPGSPNANAARPFQPGAAQIAIPGPTQQG